MATVVGGGAVVQHSSWDCALPGPPGRSNFGCSDTGPSGLLAYGAGSSVVVVDPQSMQLLAVLPMPPPSSSPLSPFVTSVRWTPQPLPRDPLLLDDPSSSHLRLAVGDRQGRIALFDLLRSPSSSSSTISCGGVHHWLGFDPSSDRSRLGIQDLCWIRGGPSASSWLIASIHGPSLLALWNAGAARCIWKYNASPDYLSCLRRDPFDHRHLCVLSLRGLLLSLRAHGDSSEDDISLPKEHRIVPPSSDSSAELDRLEREATSANSTGPALAAFPLYFVGFCFSPRWRHILLVVFPRELVVFDLHYGTALSSASLPRGCAKFLDCVSDPDADLLYCAHIDGKLSIWRRQPGEQVHVLYRMEELMPSIGTTVPSPSVLAIVLCEAESTVQSVMKHYSSDVLVVTKTHLISISDDGKVWKWLLESEGASDLLKSMMNMIEAPDNMVDGGVETVNNDQKHPVNSTCENSELSLKISLSGQLQLLSSTVTTLAVPCPSLTATLARGGNNPAVAVPLIALGTQNGTIDVVDVSANAVAASFCVHGSSVKGLRWLGNSRLVSFSYNQVSDKSGGYNNKLVVTCVRSGLNRIFRVLQKPERTPIRALRASSSGRYLLILFRDAPVEVWAMTKSPIMLRSLALPFTVLEWTLPTAPKPVQNGPPKQSSVFSKEPASAATSLTIAPPTDSKASSAEGSGDDISESFAFALVNGAVGVFEVHGRRIRDFRPKWPSSSFVSSDGLVTAMAYRLPHVVMGDRSGNIRWWDVTSGYSSSFNTHKEGIRRIKFSPVVVGDRSRGRIAVLFYDNTFSIYDLDSQDPLANSLLQPQLPGTLVLELDWLPLRTDKSEPLVLCIAGADSSVRLIEININDAKSTSLSKPRAIRERFRPMSLCLPSLFPTAHALALRMILQLGIKPTWFNFHSTNKENFPFKISESLASGGDLRSYMIDSVLPIVGDPAVPELLLKVLEPYRREGCILDNGRVGLYASIMNRGFSARFAFAAAIFGEYSEALFWLELPRALYHLADKSNKSFQVSVSVPQDKGTFTENQTPIKEKSLLGRGSNDSENYRHYSMMAFNQGELWGSANERITWHEKLDDEEAIQKRVHELVSVGNLEAAVTLLLSTPPEGSHFYANALRAIALSSAVSRSLHELAVKVVAANMVRTDKSLSGIHLLCAVGRFQEACSQLQDAGCWTDAATLAATHLRGSDYARVLQRWADHILHNQHNIWRALILYVAAGAFHEALATLRDSQLPDAAAMFLLACQEINAEILSKSGDSDESSSEQKQQFVLPGMDRQHEDVVAVSEYYGHYQRKLVHLCMDAGHLFD
ncbi:hypothetical protein QJS10_CPA07g00650 [Acorus calamus]|uniref:WD repeat-containing protein 11 n=1 Tax=Acorus calamus TaxID=4465 RepID=A0AAV9EH33_ACOCL|nr:hypothetical protein QJS10_CPA07g00628 [Acorus calamus]KAK1312821.1 hypothetical protein QJS10_CPA07g00650 [Acorus calamus]